MARQNKPALIDPANTVRDRTDKGLGIATPRNVNDAIDEMARRIGGMNRELQALQGMATAAQVLAFASPSIVPTSDVKVGVSPTNITSTVGTTVTNSNLTGLIPGTKYLVIAIAAMSMNAPSGQSIIACVRIGASGSTIDGTPTTTVGGERWGMAFTTLELISDGTSVNIAGRARVSGGTGSVNACISFGVAFPQGAAVAV